MLWVGGIGAGVVAILIIVGIIVASAGSSFTWTGNLDDRAFRDGPWHSYDEDCDTMSRTTYDADGSAKTKGECDEGDGFTMDIDNAREHYSWPTSQISADVTYDFDNGESASAEVIMHMRNAIVTLDTPAKSVWFAVPEYYYVDGEYYSASEFDADGECIALVSDAAMEGSSSWSNWDDAVHEANWPYFCDSVFSY